MSVAPSPPPGSFSRRIPAACRNSVPAVAAALLALSLSGSSTPAAAQQSAGPFLGVGVGAAVRLDDPERVLADRFGPAGWVRGGWALQQGPLVGVEWTRGWIATSFTTLDRQSLSVVLQWPFGPTRESHVKAGVGAGRGTVVRVDDPPQGGGGERVVSAGEQGGMALTVGTSYRVAVRTHLVINPGVDLHLMRVGERVQGGVHLSVGLLAGPDFGWRARRRRPPPEG